MCNNEWELIEKSAGGGKFKGTAWEQFPCVRIIKSGLQWNRKAWLSWLDNAWAMHIMVSNERQAFAVKLVEPEEDGEGAYTITGKNAKAGKCLYVSCKRIAEKFPSSLGLIYRAHKNASGNLIVVEVSDENRVRITRAAT